ncbi:hypothetical protein [Chishuiella changwenlii]|uniref:hypothetical protein n=1 Tax=Chishuiella changwenlii TaxID=1434701 RepID=UPI002FDA2CB3
MKKNNKILIYSLINITTILFISCFGGNNKDDNEYIYVDWTPNNENIAGLYLLNIEDHKNLFKKDSFYLKLGKDNSFTTKNFFYSEFGSDSIIPIPYAEGTWSFNEEKSYGKILLNFNEKYNQFNGIDEFKNKNNTFLTIINVQMNKKDSSYLFTIFNGDSDSRENRYYYYQINKKEYLSK